MENEQLIAADDFCHHYRVEQTFIYSLCDAGLIEVTRMEEKVYLDPAQLPDVEKFARMHYELNINMEGLEAIAHLLQLIKDMQDEMNILRNRLSIYDRGFNG